MTDKSLALDCFLLQPDMHFKRFIPKNNIDNNSLEGFDGQKEKAFNVDV